MMNRRRKSHMPDPNNDNNDSTTTTTTTKLTLSNRTVSFTIFSLSFGIVMGIILFVMITYRHHQDLPLSPTRFVRDDATTGIIGILHERPVDQPLVECTVITPLFPSTEPNNESVQSIGTSIGTIRITVRMDLSPIASQVFLDLVNDQYYDGVYIFRVLKGFIAQWGYRGNDDDENNPRWNRPSETKDMIHNNTLSNVRGTLSFAGGNPSIRQVFVNLGNNERLDKENSRPFATVDEDGSMRDVVDHLYMGYQDGQGQIVTMNQGEEAVQKKFPRMSKIEQCRVVPF